MDKKILLVEDEQDIREAMEEALQEAGFEVITADNGVTGLKAALEEKPDLILLDIIMPEMDGHAMLAKLRGDSWGKHVKVIMLTSMDNVTHVAGAHELKITDYIIKAHSSLDDIVKKVRLEVLAD